MTEDDIQAVFNMLTRHGASAIDPSEEQLRGLLSGNQEGPFHFVNLLRFRETAQYPEDHELHGKAMTGSEAYDLTALLPLPTLHSVAGRLMTMNNVERSLIGSSGPWHRVATMEYQSIGAFIEMLIDPEYEASLVHRNAGLEATEVIATRPLITEPVG